MKSFELRQKSNIELSALLAEKKTKAEELRWLLLQHKVKNTKALREVKKDIARIITVLREA